MNEFESDEMKEVLQSMVCTIDYRAKVTGLETCHMHTLQHVLDVGAIRVAWNTGVTPILATVETGEWALLTSLWAATYERIGPRCDIMD